MNADKKRTQESWRGMKERCDNPFHKDFLRYGGRGIRYPVKWEELDAFISDMGYRPLGLELDRKYNDASYSKDNCQWITHAENSRKTSHCKLSAEKVRWIKALLRSIKPGVTTTSANIRISEVFGVSESTIQAIRTARRWHDVV